MTEPKVLEHIDTDVVIAELIARMQSLFPEWSAAGIETDPIMKILEVFGYIQILVRGRINDAALATMPKWAVGADLDNLAALLGVERRLFQAEDRQHYPPTQEIWETDAAFRERVLIAPERLAAGSEAGYRFCALSAGVEPKMVTLERADRKITVVYELPADGVSARVLDASAVRVEPGKVVVTVLAEPGFEAVAVSQVNAAIQQDWARQIADYVVVQPAIDVPFKVIAQVTRARNHDPLLLTVAGDRVAEWLANRRLGKTVAKSALYRALHINDFDSVEILEPTGDVVCSLFESPLVVEIKVSYA